MLPTAEYISTATMALVVQDAGGKVLAEVRNIPDALAAVERQTLGLNGKQLSRCARIREEVREWQVSQ